MLCYKDMTFCSSNDCSNLECIRNTRRDDFTPDDYWKDKICYGDLASKCPNYKKGLNNE